MNQFTTPFNKKRKRGIPKCTDAARRKRDMAPRQDIVSFSTRTREPGQASSARVQERSFTRRSCIRRNNSQSDQTRRSFLLIRRIASSKTWNTNYAIRPIGNFCAKSRNPNVIKQYFWSQRRVKRRSPNRTE